MTNKSTRTPREDTQLAVMANDMKYVVKSVDDINAKLSSDYVPIDRFAPIEKLVYGMVSLVLIAVVGAILTLVIRK